MKQDKVFLSQREKVKKYIKISDLVGINNNTYQKLSGVILNNKKNGDLTAENLETISRQGREYLNGLEVSKKALKWIIKRCEKELREMKRLSIVLLVVLVSSCYGVKKLDPANRYAKTHKDKSWEHYQKTWKKNEIKAAKENARIEKERLKAEKDLEKHLAKMERIKNK